MSTTPIPSAEQQARELLGRMNIPGADTMTAGDLVELGNLIAAYWQRGAALDAERAAVANINAARRHEADRLTAENQRLRAALDYLEQHILRGTLAINLHPDASGPRFPCATGHAAKSPNAPRRFTCANRTVWI